MIQKLGHEKLVEADIARPCFVYPAISCTCGLGKLQDEPTRCAAMMEITLHFGRAIAISSRNAVPVMIARIGGMRVVRPRLM